MDNFPSSPITRLLRFAYSRAKHVLVALRFVKFIAGFEYIALFSACFKLYH